ncbi:MAG: hypothetical protein BWK77_04195 [Verrucomicrobia bacterium A1]|nr:MAG: hypothetical protein BWK77_04195 [Verrucomicrobia bacterium A1]
MSTREKTGQPVVGLQAEARRPVTAETAMADDVMVGTEAAIIADHHVAEPRGQGPIEADPGGLGLGIHVDGFDLGGEPGGREVFPAQFQGVSLGNRRGPDPEEAALQEIRSGGHGVEIIIVDVDAVVAAITEIAALELEPPQ